MVLYIIYIYIYISKVAGKRPTGKSSLVVHASARCGFQVGMRLKRHAPDFHFCFSWRDSFLSPFGHADLSPSLASVKSYVSPCPC